MNTQTDVSSGLVAVAWVPDDVIAKLRSGEPKIVLTGVPMLKYEGVNTSAIVLLSDAEEIIQQQAERIKELKAERGYSQYCAGCNEAAKTIEKQAERIKELWADLSEEAHIRDRMAQLLAETAVALKGPEKALHRHGWQDLPKVAAKYAEIERLERESSACDLIEEQKGTITALNMALGGEDSTSTENLIDANEVDYNEEGLISLCRKLIAENVRLSDVIESTGINDTIEALGFANREIERLTKSESDWIACHARIFRELQDTKTVVGNQAERIAELEASPISEEVIDILRSRIAKQSAALKLAKDALKDYAQFRPTDLSNEALAAINALGEYK